MVKAWLRIGDAATFSSLPWVATSQLIYATAVSFSQGTYCSTHSVEPMRPYSSPSHDAKTIVRRGFHPAFKAIPNDRITSFIALEPLLGSPAPPAIPVVCQLE